ncbi:hypothetical protein Cadr_000028678 [Camelus dromedarius]|uniref:Uncharacterized protein n=1 Tax=Camelus dromedarius TaxID=9838 RepID=A0A5N4C7P9_CAMDR|nr:hypothetical protein Cadr_000028678 [Camelus dromedarius]
MVSVPASCLLSYTAPIHPPAPLPGPHLQTRMCDLCSQGEGFKAVTHWPSLSRQVMATCLSPRPAQLRGPGLPVAPLPPRPLLPCGPTISALHVAPSVTALRARCNLHRACPGTYSVNRLKDTGRQDYDCSPFTDKNLSSGDLGPPRPTVEPDLLSSCSAHGGGGGGLSPAAAAPGKWPGEPSPQLSVHLLTLQGSESRGQRGGGADNRATGHWCPSPPKDHTDGISGVRSSHVKMRRYWVWNRRQAPGEAAVGVSGRNRSPWLTEDVCFPGTEGVACSTAAQGPSTVSRRVRTAQLTARKGGVQGAHPGGLDQRRELWGRNGPHPSRPFPPGPAPGPHPASWRLHGLLCQGETDAEELTRRRKEKDRGETGQRRGQTPRMRGEDRQVPWRRAEKESPGRVTGRQRKETKGRQGDVCPGRLSVSPPPPCTATPTSFWIFLFVHLPRGSSCSSRASGAGSPPGQNLPQDEGTGGQITELIRPSRRALSQVLTCLLTSVSRPVPLTALAPVCLGGGVSRLACTGQAVNLDRDIQPRGVSPGTGHEPGWRTSEAQEEGELAERADGAAEPAGHAARPGSQAPRFLREADASREQPTSGARGGALLTPAQHSLLAASLSLEEGPRSRAGERALPLLCPPPGSISPCKSRGSHQQPQLTREEAGCTGGVSVNRGTEGGDSGHGVWCPVCAGLGWDCSGGRGRPIPSCRFSNSPATSGPRLLSRTAAAECPGFWVRRTLGLPGLILSHCSSRVPFLPLLHTERYLSGSDLGGPQPKEALWRFPPDPAHSQAKAPLMLPSPTRLHLPPQGHPSPPLHPMSRAPAVPRSAPGPGREVQCLVEAHAWKTGTRSQMGQAGTEVKWEETGKQQTPSDQPSICFASRQHQHPVGGPGWLRLTATGPGLGTRSRDPALSGTGAGGEVTLGRVGERSGGMPADGSISGGRTDIQVLAQDPRAETPPPPRAERGSEEERRTRPGKPRKPSSPAVLASQPLKPIRWSPRSGDVILFSFRREGAEPGWSSADLTGSAPRPARFLPCQPSSNPGPAEASRQPAESCRAGGGREEGGARRLSPAAGSLGASSAASMFILPRPLASCQEPVSWNPGLSLPFPTASPEMFLCSAKHQVPQRNFLSDQCCREEWRADRSCPLFLSHNSKPQGQTALLQGGPFTPHILRRTKSARGLLLASFQSLHWATPVCTSPHGLERWGPRLGENTAFPHPSWRSQNSPSRSKTLTPQGLLLWTWLLGTAPGPGAERSTPSTGPRELGARPTADAGLNARPSWPFLSPWLRGQDVSGEDRSEDEGEATGRKDDQEWNFCFGSLSPGPGALARTAPGPTDTRSSRTGLHTGNQWPSRPMYSEHHTSQASFLPVSNSARMKLKQTVFSQAPRLLAPILSAEGRGRLAGRQSPSSGWLLQEGVEGGGWGNLWQVGCSPAWGPGKLGAVYALHAKQTQDREKHLRTGERGLCASARSRFVQGSANVAWCVGCAGTYLRVGTAPAGEGISRIATKMLYQGPPVLLSWGPQGVFLPGQKDGFAAPPLHPQEACEEGGKGGMDSKGGLGLSRSCHPAPGGSSPIVRPEPLSPAEARLGQRLQDRASPGTVPSRPRTAEPESHSPFCAPLPTPAGGGAPAQMSAASPEKQSPPMGPKPPSTSPRSPLPLHLWVFGLHGAGPIELPRAGLNSNPSRRGSRGTLEEEGLRGARSRRGGSSPGLRPPGGSCWRLFLPLHGRHTCMDQDGASGHISVEGASALLHCPSLLRSTNKKFETPKEGADGPSQGPRATRRTACAWRPASAIRAGGTLRTDALSSPPAQQLPPNLQREALSTRSHVTSRLVSPQIVGRLLSVCALAFLPERKAGCCALCGVYRRQGVGLLSPGDPEGLGQPRANDSVSNLLVWAALCPCPPCPEGNHDKSYICCESLLSLERPRPSIQTVNPELLTHFVRHPPPLPLPLPKTLGGLQTGRGRGWEQGRLGPWTLEEKNSESDEDQHGPSLRTPALTPDPGPPPQEGSSPWGGAPSEEGDKEPSSPFLPSLRLDPPLEPSSSSDGTAAASHRLGQSCAGTRAGGAEVGKTQHWPRRRHGPAAWLQRSRKSPGEGVGSSRCTSEGKEALEGWAAGWCAGGCFTVVRGSFASAVEETKAQRRDLTKPTEGGPRPQAAAQMQSPPQAPAEEEDTGPQRGPKGDGIAQALSHWPSPLWLPHSRWSPTTTRFPEKVQGHNGPNRRPCPWNRWEGPSEPEEDGHKGRERKKSGGRRRGGGGEEEGGGGEEGEEGEKEGGGEGERPWGLEDGCLPGLCLHWRSLESLGGGAWVAVQRKPWCQQEGGEGRGPLLSPLQMPLPEHARPPAQPLMQLTERGHESCTASRLSPLPRVVWWVWRAWAGGCLTLGLWPPEGSSGPERPPLRVSSKGEPGSTGESEMLGRGARGGAYRSPKAHRTPWRAILPLRTEHETEGGTALRSKPLGPRTVHTRAPSSGECAVCGQGRPRPQRPLTLPCPHPADPALSCGLCPQPGPHGLALPQQPWAPGPGLCVFSAQPPSPQSPTARQEGLLCSDRPQGTRTGICDSSQPASPTHHLGPETPPRIKQPSRHPGLAWAWACGAGSCWERLGRGQELLGREGLSDSLPPGRPCKDRPAWLPVKASQTVLPSLPPQGSRAGGRLHSLGFYVDRTMNVHTCAGISADGHTCIQTLATSQPRGLATCRSSHLDVHCDTCTPLLADCPRAGLGHPELCPGPSLRLRFPPSSKAPAQGGAKTQPRVLPGGGTVSSLPALRHRSSCSQRGHHPPPPTPSSPQAPSSTWRAEPQTGQSRTVSCVRACTAPAVGHYPFLQTRGHDQQTSQVGARAHGVWGWGLQAVTRVVRACGSTWGEVESASRWSVFTSRLVSGSAAWPRGEDVSMKWGHHRPPQQGCSENWPSGRVRVTGVWLTETRGAANTLQSTGCPTRRVTQPERQMVQRMRTPARSWPSSCQVTVHLSLRKFSQVVTLCRPAGEQGAVRGARVAVGPGGAGEGSRVRSWVPEASDGVEKDCLASRSPSKLSISRAPSFHASHSARRHGTPFRTPLPRPRGRRAGHLLSPCFSLQPLGQLGTEAPPRTSGPGKSPALGPDAQHACGFSDGGEDSEPGRAGPAQRLSHVSPNRWRKWGGPRGHALSRQAGLCGPGRGRLHHHPHPHKLIALLIRRAGRGGAVWHGSLGEGESRATAGALGPEAGDFWLRTSDGPVPTARGSVLGRIQRQTRGSVLGRIQRQTRGSVLGRIQRQSAVADPALLADRLHHSVTPTVPFKAPAGSTATRRQRGGRVSSSGKALGRRRRPPGLGGGGCACCAGAWAAPGAGSRRPASLGHAVCLGQTGSDTADIWRELRAEMAVHTSTPGVLTAHPPGEPSTRLPSGSGRAAGTGALGRAGPPCLDPAACWSFSEGQRDVGTAASPGRKAARGAQPCAQTQPGPERGAPWVWAPGPPPQALCSLTDCVPTMQRRQEGPKFQDWGLRWALPSEFHRGCSRLAPGSVVSAVSGELQALLPPLQSSLVPAFPSGSPPALAQGAPVSSVVCPPCLRAPEQRGSWCLRAPCSSCASQRGQESGGQYDQYGTSVGAPISQPPPTPGPARFLSWSHPISGPSRSFLLASERPLAPGNSLALRRGLEAPARPHSVQDSSHPGRQEIRPLSRGNVTPPVMEGVRVVGGPDGTGRALPFQRGAEGGKAFPAPPAALWKPAEGPNAPRAPELRCLPRAPLPPPPLPQFTATAGLDSGRDGHVGSGVGDRNSQAVRVSGERAPWGDGARLGRVQGLEGSGGPPLLSLPRLVQTTPWPQEGSLSPFQVGADVRALLPQGQPLARWVRGAGTGRCCWGGGGRQLPPQRGEQRLGSWLRGPDSSHTHTLPNIFPKTVPLPPVHPPTRAGSCQVLGQAEPGEHEIPHRVGADNVPSKASHPCPCRDHPVASQRMYQSVDGSLTPPPPPASIPRPPPAAELALDSSSFLQEFVTLWVRTAGKEAAATWCSKCDRRIQVPEAPRGGDLGEKSPLRCDVKRRSHVIPCGVCATRRAAGASEVGLRQRVSAAPPGERATREGRGIQAQRPRTFCEDYPREGPGAPGRVRGRTRALSIGKTRKSSTDLHPLRRSAQAFKAECRPVWAAATRWCRAAGGREGWPAAPTLAPLPAGQAGRRARGGWAVDCGGRSGQAALCSPLSFVSRRDWAVGSGSESSLRREGQCGGRGPGGDLRVYPWGLRDRGTGPQLLFLYLTSFLGTKPILGGKPNPGCLPLPQNHHTPPTSPPHTSARGAPHGALLHVKGGRTPGAHACAYPLDLGWEARFRVTHSAWGGGHGGGEAESLSSALRAGRLGVRMFWGRPSQQLGRGAFGLGLCRSAKGQGVCCFENRSLKKTGELAGDGSTQVPRWKQGTGTCRPRAVGETAPGGSPGGRGGDSAAGGGGREGRAPTEGRERGAGSLGAGQRLSVTYKHKLPTILINRN